MNRKWALLVAALSATAIVANAADATTFSKQVQIGTQNRVLISNVAGSVTITSWDRKEVDVQGEVGAGVERVDVRQDNGIVDIKVELKQDNDWGGVNWRRGDARLQIKVPADAQVEASTVSASISANGVRGRQRLKSVSGDIRSDAASSDLDLKTVSGRVDLTGSGNAARVRASSVSGTVTLSHVGGDVEARSTSGDVDIDSQGAAGVHASTVSGDVSLRGALGRDADVETSSVSGRIKVTAQFPSGFNYDVTTFSGGIRNCLGVEVDRDDRRGFRGGRLSGSRGEAKATVRARSHSGSVELCDH
jgi:DUF4097 and DUF4098 domain-containing protein YvlB